MRLPNGRPTGRAGFAKICGGNATGKAREQNAHDLAKHWTTVRRDVLGQVLHILHEWRPGQVPTKTEAAPKAAARRELRVKPNLLFG